jgi:hypothetical protein
MSLSYQHEMSKTAAQLRFLWEAYKPEYWYWELVETSRRIILTAVLSICSAGSSEQSVLAVILSTAFMCLYTYYQPYGAVVDQTLSTAGHLQISLTYFFILVLAEDLMSSSWNKTFDALLITVNLWVILLGFYYECQRYLEENPDVAGLSNKIIELLMSFPSSQYKANSIDYELSEPNNCAGDRIITSNAAPELDHAIELVVVSDRNSKELEQ